MRIEIFGPGCPKCQKTEQEVAKVVKQLGIDASIEQIADIDEIVNRGVIFTPAVFIDGEKKIEGKVPRAIDIERWLKE